MGAFNFIPGAYLNDMYSQDKLEMQNCSTEELENLIQHLKPKISLDSKVSNIGFALTLASVIGACICNKIPEFEPYAKSIIDYSVAPAAAIAIAYATKYTLGLGRVSKVAAAEDVIKERSGH